MLSRGLLARRAPPWQAYLVHKKASKDMKRRVRMFCSHYYTKRGVMRETWDMLPPRMRRELIAFEHKEFFATFARLNVAGCDEVLRRLAEFVRPYHCLGTIRRVRMGPHRVRAR